MREELRELFEDHEENERDEEDAVDNGGRGAEDYGNQSDQTDNSGNISEDGDCNDKNNSNGQGESGDSAMGEMLEADDNGVNNASEDDERSSESGSGGGEPDHSSSSDEGNEGDSNLNLLEQMKIWAYQGVSINKVDEVLKILHPHHPFLPKTCRTLLKTPLSGPIQVLAGGLFWYKGIMPNLLSKVTPEYLAKYNEVVIDINIDGIPLHSSNPAHFFPLLGCLKCEPEPFIIAIWHGYSDKPSDLRAFLNDYIEEVQTLTQDGCDLFGNNYNFRIRNYILDRVARAFVKQIVGHNAIFACEKCDVEGVWYRN
ncbi:Halomucin [Frankliniella fusca]|uniref:Halomucin n=1 Tax=Frankliniella fusca TaxID=407009 RepID=A0AAE1HMK7_9NEOP|nr:Halomucin [Frankliniella fusca]